MFNKQILYNTFFVLLYKYTFINSDNTYKLFLQKLYTAVALTINTRH